MSKLLDERLVFIDADVKTSEEAIRLMAGRLQEYKLDVKLIMPLVIKDSGQQIELLKAMMHVIQDSDRLAKIRASRNKAEILDLLSSLEEA